MKKEKLQDLQKPFKPEKVEWKISATTKDKKKGLARPYISSRTVMERLDEVCGSENWKRTHKALSLKKPPKERKNWNLKTFKELDPRWNKEELTAVICCLSVKINGEWVTKDDGAGLGDVATAKGSLSGSFKRAAANWGIGRYLYEVEDNWVKIKQQGKAYVPAEQPQLPQDALPEGYNQKSEPKKQSSQPKPTQKETNSKAKESSADLKKIKGFLADYEVQEKSLLAWVAKKAGQEESFTSLEEIQEKQGSKWIKPLTGEEFWEENAAEIAEEIPF